MADKTMDDLRKTIDNALVLISFGDTRGVDILYHFAGGRMLSVAVGITKNRMSAEDVVQESFIKIVQNIHSYKKATNGYAWVLKIVRNTALNHIRYTKSRPECDIDEFHNICITDNFVDTTDNSIIVQELMSSLPLDLKNIIYYKYFMDMTIRDIAKTLGISKSFVHTKIKQAEELLKKMIDT